MAKKKNKRKNGFIFMLDVMTAFLIVALVLYTLSAINDADKGAGMRGAVLAYTAGDAGLVLEKNGTLKALLNMSAGNGGSLLNSTVNSSMPEGFGWRASVLVCSIDEIPEVLDCGSKCELLGYSHGGNCKNNNPGCNAQNEVYEPSGDRYCSSNKVCCCKESAQPNPLADCSLAYNVSSGALGGEVGVSRRVFTDGSSNFGMLQMEVWRK